MLDNNWHCSSVKSNPSALKSSLLNVKFDDFFLKNIKSPPFYGKFNFPLDISSETRYNMNCPDKYYCSGFLTIFSIVRKPLFVKRFCKEIRTFLGEGYYVRKILLFKGFKRI